MNSTATSHHLFRQANSTPTPISKMISRLKTNCTETAIILLLAITTVVPPTTAGHIPHDAENHTQHNTTVTSQAFRTPTDNASTSTTTAHSSATVLVAHLQRLFHPVITNVVPLKTACHIPHDTENHTQHNNTDTSQAPWPPTDDASLITTTEHSHITALVAHLQRLHHPPPKTHITTTIFTQPIWLDLRPFTKANTHNIAPLALKHEPNPPTISTAASSQRNSPTLIDSPTYPTFSFTHR